MSISQISETLFILAIPFFKTFWDKQVMLISMLAWVCVLIILLTEIQQWIMDDYYVFVVYGMAFDFFNISGSLFVETNTDPKIVLLQHKFYDDDQWFWSGFGKFTSDGQLINILQNHFNNTTELTGFGSRNYKSCFRICNWSEM
jgi:NHS family xanthosine MFS transporter